MRPSRQGEKAKTKKKKEPEATHPVDMVPPPPPMPGDEFAMPTREVLKPDNQLELTPAELEEEIAKMLTANNPAAAKNVVRYNGKERCYKLEPMVEQTIVHYATDGWLLHKTSEEAKAQMERDKAEQEQSAAFQAKLNVASAGTTTDGGDVEPPDDSRTLRNQFNFSDRGVQTAQDNTREKGTFTEPPLTSTVSGACTQYEIFDEYLKDQERQKADENLKAKSGKGGAKPTNNTNVAKQVVETDTDPMHSGNMAGALQILDRMVNQNMFEEISMDFKYWEDATDAVKTNEGTLLPLWRFQTETTKRKQVTALCWNPRYLDLFAVGYGSYDFLRQSSGLVCVFSLKNPSHPELSYVTESGIMCLDFHPEFSNLLAVGCYDGTVMVFDLHLKQREPIYQANVRTGKHNDPVWQIFWQAKTEKALQFMSISSDGHVILWTLNKSALTFEDQMRLRIVKAERNEGGEEDEPESSNPAAGCCMDFAKGTGQEHIYLVGTEEGSIHKCSKAYSSEYLSTYKGHDLAVYAVKWNFIHHRVFLSASADWTVKLWDAADSSKPVMSFDLRDSVGDVAWAPYSSTVFAACTDDGKVHVFDLNENKLLPLCSQKFVKKAKLTKLSFNPKHPVLLVGDDRGCVTSLKLSPNLRKSSKPEKGQVLEQLEIEKLDKVIGVARKCDVGPTPAAS